MGMIFGSDGTRQWNEGPDFVNIDRNGNTDFTQDMGGDLFSFSGKRTYGMGFTDHGQIFKNGDTWVYNGKTYQKQGDMLYLSDGKTFTGIGGMSDRDVENIILHDR